MTLRFSTLAFALAAALLPVAPALAHDATTHAADHGADVVNVGALEISGAFTRATLPNAPVGGGFFTITNKGSEDDRLTSATSEIARDTQIHEMAMENDVMKMRQLTDGISIPAGETVVLAPGGLHLMFMGLAGSIKEGDAVPVTLTFEKAGTVTLNLLAGATAADAPAHSMH